MGWNTGYTIFESTVVGAYDLGKLDKDLLRVLMEPYAGSDIDSGGSRGLLSKDGLCVEEIVVKIHGVKMPARPDADAGSEAGWTGYYEEVYESFREITKEFDWR